MAGPVAYRDHVVELLIFEFRNILGPLTTNIDPDLFHNFETFRMKPFWVSARTEYLEGITGQMSQDTFGHLASGGIACAEEQDLFPVGHRRDDNIHKASSMLHLCNMPRHTGFPIRRQSGLLAISEPGETSVLGCNEARWAASIVLLAASTNPTGR